MLEELPFLDRDSSCVHGHWEDGVCVCARGYRTTFVEIALKPRYCATDITIVIGHNPYDSEKLLHWSAMAMTMIITSIAIIAAASFIFSIASLFWIKNQIVETRQAVLLFDAQRYKLGEDSLTAELWDVPEHFQCISPKDKPEVEEKPAVAKALHKYKAQAEDEFSLQPGDIITDVVKLEHGWCKGKRNGKTGFFPGAFVEILESETDLEVS